MNRRDFNKALAIVPFSVLPVLSVKTEDTWASNLPRRRKIKGKVFVFEKIITTHTHVPKELAIYCREEMGQPVILQKETCRPCKPLSDIRVRHRVSFDRNGQINSRPSYVPSGQKVTCICLENMSLKQSLGEYIDNPQPIWGEMGTSPYVSITT